MYESTKNDSLDEYQTTPEYITIKGCKSALRWITDYLMQNRISYLWDNMTGYISFVQLVPVNLTSGMKTDIVRIIENCPSKKWDIVNQFQCSYPDIGCR